MTTLIEQFNKTANKYTEHTAMVFQDQKIEYGRMSEAVKRLAQGLRNIGIEETDKVALLLPNIPHFPISYYAIFELGAVVVPINIMLPAEEIQYYLQDSGAKALITWEGFRLQVMKAVEGVDSRPKLIFLGQKIPAGTICLQRLMANSNPIEKSADVTPDTMAALIYTAGIADAPIAAEMSHGNLSSNAATCREMLMINADERLIGVMPLFHPLGQTLVMNTAFMAGAAIVLQPKFDAAKTMQLIQEHSITYMAGVPGMYMALIDVDLGDSPANSLRYCLSYGGYLDESVIEAFESKFDALLLNSYGVSEAGPLVAACRIDRERKKDSVGFPLVGMEIRVLDESGEELGSNQVGELAIRGASVTKGYYNRPAATKIRFKDDWLLTGDIGKIDEDLYCYIIERKEDLILKGGFNIYPREIENVLRKHPAVADVAVVGVSDELQGQEVKACVVLKEGHDANSNELIAFCSDQGLEVYKTPAYIDFFEALPKSATGRVLKRELRESLKVEEGVLENGAME